VLPVLMWSYSSECNWYHLAGFTPRLTIRSVLPPAVLEGGGHRGAGTCDVLIQWMCHSIFVLSGRCAGSSQVLSLLHKNMRLSLSLIQILQPG